MKPLFNQIEYPIVLAPMLGVVTPEMVAAVSESGGLGLLPLGGQTPERALELISKVKSLTKKLFGVNLFVNTEPDFAENRNRIEKMRAYIEGIVKGKGWADTYDFDYHFNSYKDLIDLLIREEIKVVTFTFGIPDEESMAKLKAHNVTLIGTATCTEEAVLLEIAGADLVIAQGIEAGGHRGTFIKGELPRIPLSVLIPEIARDVEIPVIASGGIHGRKTMDMAFRLGASAVQIGSHFIPAEESLATETYKEILRTSIDTSTWLTQSFSGRWARGIKNEFMKNTRGMYIPDYPIQNQLMRGMRNLAKAHDDYQYTSLWAGQNARFAKRGTTKAIMKKLIAGYKTMR